MQDGPLLVSGILRRGQAVYGDSQVVTAQPDGYRESTFTQVGARAEQLAKALRRLGVGDDDRVGHLRLERPGASRGVPGDPVDGGGAPHAQHPSVPRAAGLCGQPRRGQGRHRRRLGRAAVRPGPRRVQDGGAHHRGGGGRHDGARRHHVLRRSRRRRGARVRLARARRTPGGVDVLHERHHRQSQRGRLQPPLDVAARLRGHDHQLRGRQREGPRARDRAHVPRQRLGDALHGVLRRDRPDLPRALPPGRAVGPHHRRAAAHAVARRPHHLERPAATTRRATTSTCRRCGCSPRVGRRCRARSWRRTRSASTSP